MKNTMLIGAILGGAFLAATLSGGCHDEDNDGNLDTVGQPCEVAEDCYPGVEHEDLLGEVICLGEVEGGYCTHLCETDEDCCAVEGECDEENDLVYLCAPFESTGQKFCFISCEDTAEMESNEYCQHWAHLNFICRSTGGGSENRRVCVPEG